MAQTYLKTDGDIRAVLRTMLDSPEFWSAEAYRAKIKTPFELVASAARAAGSERERARDAGAVDRPHRRAALPIPGADRLSGYGGFVGEHGRAAEPAEFLAGAGGESLAGRARGYGRALAGRQPGDSKAVLERAIDVLLGGEVSPETRRTLESRLSDPQIVQASLDDPIREINNGVVAGSGTGRAGISASLSERAPSGKGELR